MKTNPNGANQYLLDPRQQECWENYINPKSETYSNAFQSAIKAGYEEATAGQITTYDWFLEKRRRFNLLGKAEKIFDKTLSYETEDKEGVIKTDLLRVQADIAKHISKTLGKDEGYTERQEHSGENGGPVKIDIVKVLDKAYGDRTGEVHSDS